MQPDRIALSAYWRVLRDNRNFRLLWMAQIVSEIGDWFFAIAIYSLILDLTGSAEAVALAVVLQVLPQIAIAPAAGAINDRVSRKSVMILADLGRAAVVLCMLVVRSAETLWIIYVLLAMETFLWGFFEPGRTSVIPNITRKDDLVVANALSSVTWSFNLMIGATVGGIVAVVLGRETVFVLNAISFLVSAALLRRMRFAEPHTETTGRLRWRDLTDFSPILEGVRYVRRDAKLFATLLLKAGIGFMGANLVMLPVFGERVFPVHIGELDARRAGMLGMSLLMGSRGIGALLGPIAAGYWAGRKVPKLRNGILIGFLAGSLGYLLLSIAPNIWLACACVILAHAGGSIVWVFSTTLLHLATEDRFRGRVFSADFAFLFLTVAVFSYFGGKSIDLGLSVHALAAVTGCLMLLPASFWLLTLRRWRGEKDLLGCASERSE